MQRLTAPTLLLASVLPMLVLGFFVGNRGQPGSTELAIVFWGTLWAVCAFVAIQLMWSARASRALLLAGFILVLFAIYQLILGAVFGFESASLERALQALFASMILGVGWVAGTASVLRRGRWFLFSYATASAVLCVFFAANAILDGGWFNDNVPGYGFLFSVVVGVFIAQHTGRRGLVAAISATFLGLAAWYSARGGIVAGFVVLLLVLLAPALRRNWFLFYAPLVGVSVLGMLITVSVMASDIPSWLASLDEFSRRIFGHSLLAGRDRLWQEIAIPLGQRPAIGHGPQAQMSDFLDVGLSAHSLYLQVLLQNGVLGLTLLTGALLVLCQYFYKHRMRPTAVLAYAFIVAIVAHQFFSVSLTQATFSYGALMWLLLGLLGGYTSRSFSSGEVVSPSTAHGRSPANGPE